MKYNDAEKLEEILRDTINSMRERDSKSERFDAFLIGKLSICEELLGCIDSLTEKPTSEDLDEAASFYVNTHMEWFDSEGNPYVMPAFKAGAEWYKQQLMKNAVELHIVESFNPIGTENKKPHGFTALCYNAEYPDFYPVTGQTIKVIPTKEIQQ